VTLGRLILAWLPVAALFVVVGAFGARFYLFHPAEPGDPAPAPPSLWLFTPWRTVWHGVEAGVVVLFASLWFDSLGHGGWWLLFMLVGLLAGLQRVHSLTVAPPPGWGQWLGLLVARDVVRYVIAGGILAWTLG